MFFLLPSIPPWTFPCRMPSFAMHVINPSSAERTNLLSKLCFCPRLAGSLLKGAEVLGIRKPLKRAYGGGITEFVYMERHRFSGIDQPSYFLTSQERQSIVRHTLFKLQSNGTDSIGDLQFVPGQPISSYCFCQSKLITLVRQLKGS